MKRAAIAAGALAAGLLVVLVATRSREVDRDPGAGVPGTLGMASSTRLPAGGSHLDFLYGRVTTDDGTIHEGRLRWGGDEEAFWGDFFNGYKVENLWAAHLRAEQLKESVPIEILGLRIATREREINLLRPFRARFGDIRRIEAQRHDIRVTLKSGTVFDLDGLNADDIADGLRVWDARRGVLDFDESKIRIVELLSPGRGGVDLKRLHGTVRTQQGDFTGFVQWNRRDCVGSDELHGETDEGDLNIAFDTIGAIERQSHDASRVTLVDGRELVLSGTPEVGHGNRGIYVDDRRYGRVLVSWDAFERVDFSPADSSPGYDDFPAGHSLRGRVTTREGRSLVGRLVYDLDESETTETLDAPFEGINYAIPFGLIASIVPASNGESGTQLARVVLHSGEKLQLEPAGDLSEGNPGMLIFGDQEAGVEFVPWTDLVRVDFDRPPAMYPPLDGT